MTTHDSHPLRRDQGPRIGPPAEKADRYAQALSKIAAQTESGDPCRRLVNIAREALREYGGNGEAATEDAVIDRLWERSGHGTRREDVVAAYQAGKAARSSVRNAKGQRMSTQVDVPAVELLAVLNALPPAPLYDVGETFKVCVESAEDIVFGRRFFFVHAPPDDVVRAATFRVARIECDRGGRIYTKNVWRLIDWPA